MLYYRASSVRELFWDSKISWTTLLQKLQSRKQERLFCTIPILSKILSITTSISIDINFRIVEILYGQTIITKFLKDWESRNYLFYYFYSPTRNFASSSNALSLLKSRYREYCARKFLSKQDTDNNNKIFSCQFFKKRLAKVIDIQLRLNLFSQEVETISVSLRAFDSRIDS